jgi:hypothetical protein
MIARKFRRIEDRVVKLAERRKPSRRSVLYDDEPASLAQGLPFVRVPRKCATVQEWIARYAPALENDGDVIPVAETG